MDLLEHLHLSVRPQEKSHMIHDTFFIFTNPQADAWRVGLILFLKKVFLWYTLLSIDSTQSEINDSGLACRKSDF